MADAVVVGAGPAGCATALALRQRGIRVGLVGSPRASGSVETLPPTGLGVLERLGLLREVLTLGFARTSGTRAAWDSQEVEAHSFLSHGGGFGLHIDRAVFDGWLHDRVREAGVHLADSVGPVDPGTWLVDATGRRAVLARREGSQVVRHDRQVAIMATLAHGDVDPRALVEASDEGWWYSAASANALTVACFTDNTIARSEGLHGVVRWREAMPPHTRERCQAIPGSLRVFPAHTQRLTSMAGRRWLAVGDAAWTLDPLSSQGLVKALSDGAFAAECIVAGDLGLYGRTQEAAFARAQRDAVAVYGRQTRFDGPFWRHRRGEVWLDPRARLSRGAHGSRPLGLDPAERDRLWSSLPGTTAASVAATTPREPRRALMALQDLVLSGAVRLQESP